MNRCPITFEPCEGRYSARGLGQLSRRLAGLQELPWSSTDLRQQAAARGGLSAVLNVKGQCFDLVDRGGRFILKPPVADLPEVPQNENVTMHLATLAGLEVPLHGLVYGRDGEATYFVRRFDRVGRTGRLHVEDFAQLSGQTRETQSCSSMEQVAALVEEFCTFPAVEKIVLFRLTLFSFLVGHEDLHLENFSLLHDGDVVRLSPAYGLLNTAILPGRARADLALPLDGRTSDLHRRDLVDYFGRGRLALPSSVVERVLAEAKLALATLPDALEASLLSPEAQRSYRDVVEERSLRLFAATAATRQGPLGAA